MSGMSSLTTSLSSSRLNERPVNLVGIGPRGRSVSFFVFFEPGPFYGFASGPKLRLLGGWGAGGPKRGPPKPPRPGPPAPPPPPLLDHTGRRRPHPPPAAG